jgi:hypothetical protein
LRPVIITGDIEAEKYEQLRQENEELKCLIDSLSTAITKQKIDYNYNYDINVLYPKEIKQKKRDTVTFWHVYYKGVNYEGSYGVKLNSFHFNEMEVLKKVDKKRGKDRNSIGGVLFYKQITPEEYFNCEAQK